MIRMIMHGCGGAMGHTITGLAKDMKEIEIAAGVDLKEDTSLGYPVFPSLEACDVEADVIVDFASAKAVDHLLDYCGEKKMPLVLCTTGLSEEQLQKVDAPSGTALALADSINEAMDGQYHYVYDRSQKREKRDEKEIGISAVRGGSIVGEHEVIFAGKDEVITFSHTAYSKAIFGKGALEAAVFLAGKEPGLYTMADVINAAS